MGRSETENVVQPGCPLVEAISSNGNKFRLSYLDLDLGKQLGSRKSHQQLKATYRWQIFCFLFLFFWNLVFVEKQKQQEQGSSPA